MSSKRQPRQLQSAGMYYRLSTKSKKATTLAPEEAAAATASLAPVDELLPSGSNDPNLSVAQSWRVSSEEFIIKIDASPVHMSAAQRMFGGKAQNPPKDLTKEQAEDFIATIDDAPLHRSAARRMFEDKGDETAEHADDWSNFWHNMFAVVSGK